MAIIDNLKKSTNEVENLSWEKITDKPFGEDESITITYDGNQEGKEVVELSNGTYVKISDIPIILEEGNLVIENTSGSDVSSTLEADYIINAETHAFAETNNAIQIISCYADSAVVYGLHTITKGTYCMQEYETYIKSLTGRYAKQIEEKYIPDNVKIPSCTTEDEGKFLIVVDGVPSWVALTDVSEVGA